MCVEKDKACPKFPRDCYYYQAFAALKLHQEICIKKKMVFNIVIPWLKQKMEVIAKTTSKKNNVKNGYTVLNQLKVAHVLKQLAFRYKFRGKKSVYLRSGKSHMRSTVSLRSFRNVGFGTVPMFN